MLRNLVVVIGSAVLTGCLYASGTEKQRSFNDAEVKKIERGRTTKEEILRWFGPPLAIARKDEGDKIIPPENVRAETFLELFAAKHTLTEGDVVYYYRNVEAKNSGGVVLFVVLEDRRLATSKLWVLIDNGNGIVKDFVTGETR
jgi:hypothetical protein